MKRFIILFVIVLTTNVGYSKNYKFRKHKCKVAQNHIQYEHSKPACKDRGRRYRNWDSRPKDNTFMFIFKLD